MLVGQKIQPPWDFLFNFFGLSPSDFRLRVYLQVHARLFGRYRYLWFLAVISKPVALPPARH